MLQLESRLLAFACAMCVAAWCLASKSIDCNKVFVPADVAGILTGPATISPEKLLGPGGCRFETANGAIITTYVASDMDAEVMWNDVSATADRKHYAPMSGVGDAAFWRDADATAWFLAKKGDEYCRVELGLPGGAGPAKARGVELAKMLAMLCTKAFAAR
jgi:hypothetical protein